MLSKIDRDYGTPASASTQQVTLQIDSETITVPAGTSIMHAAAVAGIKVPKLCATEAVEPFGSCRLCLVEIEGRRGFPAGCTTPVEQGMKIHTQSSKLAKLRRNVMELYISDHPLDCLTCPANGHCELQDMAGAVGLREVRYGYEGKNHLKQDKDISNPYFSFDPTKCILCSRCVRACEEVQGTFALTIDSRGFASMISPGQKGSFMESECVSCGACVQACPTATLMEKSIVENGQPDHHVKTTCAYCGVGCGFTAEVKGEQIVRMVPDPEGGANHGHSCIKGRFAWSYVDHEDRITKPMIRNTIDEPWQEVTMEEAIAFAARRFKEIQAKYGRDSVGGITSSRCTNEETYLVQKLVRAGFGNNNVDTCARVCHSPTGFGLKVTYGTSAGTQDFDSVEESDVILLIGANPTDAHPVFGSQMKKRLREGARLIVVDPRRIDLVETPHVKADYHLALRPGTNVAILNALGHVIVREGLINQAYVDKSCDSKAFAAWRDFVADDRHSPEAMAETIGVDAAAIRGAARLYATGGKAAIYYGLGVTEHSQGSTSVIAIANLAMATGNLGRRGVGVNPLRGQNNVQGSCDMGSFPHEYPGYRHVSDDDTRHLFEADWKVSLQSEPGLRIPNMFDAALDGSFKGLYVQGEDIAQSDPNTHHVTSALKSLECLVVQDLFYCETAKLAHVFLPGSSFLEKDGTFTNAERRISRVRRARRPVPGHADWEITQMLSNALGYTMNYSHPSEIMDEIARLTPSFANVSYEHLDRVGSVQWPCNDKAPEGTPIMHIDGFTHGKGQFFITEFVATDERVNRRYPLILTTGRILSQYNVGAQSRRTPNSLWHDEDRLELHPHDAEDRGIKDGDWVGVASRSGETVMRAKVSSRMQPGVVYTTFHFPESGANVVTTEYSDWATNCPEYKVTAVEVARLPQAAAWKHREETLASAQVKVTSPAPAGH